MFRTCEASTRAVALWPWAELVERHRGRGVFVGMLFGQYQENKNMQMAVEISNRFDVLSTLYKFICWL